MSPESRSSVRDVTPFSADARDSGIELWNGIDKEEAAVDQLEEVEEYFGQQFGGQPMNGTMETSKNSGRSSEGREYVVLCIVPSTLWEGHRLERVQNQRSTYTPCSSCWSKSEASRQFLQRYFPSAAPGRRCLPSFVCAQLACYFDVGQQLSLRRQSLQRRCSEQT